MLPRNTADDEIERQFQADLEKAAALSMETLALDQFKKRKKSLPYNNNSAPRVFQRSNTDITPPPLPPRHSQKEADLINFNIEEEEIPLRKSETPKLAKLREDLAQIYKATPEASVIQQNNLDMQLVPFNNQTKRSSLTPQDLANLYNMNRNVSVYSMYPGHGVNNSIQFNSQSPQNTPSQPYSVNLSQTPSNLCSNYSTYSTPPSVQSMSDVNNYPLYVQRDFYNAPQFPQMNFPVTPPAQSLFPRAQSNSSNISNHSNNSFAASTPNNSFSAAAIAPPPPIPLRNDPTRTSTSRPTVKRRENSLTGVASTSAQSARDLIDLEDVDESSQTSILDTFDPLASPKRTSTEDAENSYYTDYDPFEYIYSGGTEYSDPLYEAVIRKNDFLSPKVSPPTPRQSRDFGTDVDSDAPPLPPRNYDYGAVEPNGGENPYSNDRSAKLFENVVLRKNYDRELIAFFTMVTELRSKYKFDDPVTNIGHVVAMEFDNKYLTELKTIKFLVYPAIECFSNECHQRLMQKNDIGVIEGYAAPTIFTCDVNSPVELVINHVLCELEGQIKGAASDFALKMIGSQEWLCPTTLLSRLQCIHTSIKLEHDVQLGLFPKHDQYMKAIARTRQDDLRDAELKLENILPKEPNSNISYDNLMILLETLELEIDKLENMIGDNSYGGVSCSGVSQAVKAICALLGSIDTIEVFDAVNALKECCLNNQPSYKIKSSSASYIYNKSSTVNIVSEKGGYAEVVLQPRKISDQIKCHCNQVRDAVQHLLEMYSEAFHVNFSVIAPKWELNPVAITEVSEMVMLNIICLHRPPNTWKHDEYVLGVQIYHGTKYISPPVIAQCSSNTSGMYPRLTFNNWLNFNDMAVCQLPRESRLVFVLYGCTKEPTNPDNSNDTSQQPDNITKVELGWSALQFFDFEKNMVQGTHFLALWPPSADKYFTPAPSRGTHPIDTCPILSVEIPNYGGKLVFPEEIKNNPTYFDFNSLDQNLQEELIDTIDQSSCNKSDHLDKREVLWEKRFYLQTFPDALPKVLAAAHSWDYVCRSELHSLLRTWTPLQPMQALELLLPRFVDDMVRAQAVMWMDKMSNDDLTDFLPQLLQALKHDTYEASYLSMFLLKRSLDSPRVAHHLYWSLVHSLPGDSPQNTFEMCQNLDETAILQARYHRRNQLMIRALLAICGEKLMGKFLAQNMLCKELGDVAKSVKVAKDSMKLKILQQNIENVHHILLDSPTSLPLGPGLEVTGVVAKTCNYFTSNTLPLKINFLGPDHQIIPAIFKAGDDLQQDMLTLQMVRLMDKMWLKEGLDLKMVTFQCIPTGDKKGIIEMITNADTLRMIQSECGLTGSFKDKPIAEWLQKQNPSQLEYERAVDNFTLSCAGYCVITYLLGICDRHSSNIILKTSGHLFHIDFGKFLGDSQMIGNFKRDRTPFILTSDMAYVINNGDRATPRFHRFVDLCCQAFNIVRKHGDLLVHMFALMATSGINGVNGEGVNYVRKALLPEQSNPEASASFAKMIHVSLKSWFVQINFFFHNLAQLRFSSDTPDGQLLSFIPKTYTVAQDGYIQKVLVHGFQKRYDLEKYYTYILIVYRQNNPDPAYLFRSYKEFCELHQKLCLDYPLAKLHSLQNGIHVGRSNIKTVAERRLPEVRKFIDSLLKVKGEILNSDRVITFFHPLLRDQEETDIHVLKKKEIKQLPPPDVQGEIKFSMQYHRGALIVMIQHAKSLSLVNGTEPNTYVKVYLKPDHSKVTKRKTKLIKKNCYPSFMETLEYRMPLDTIKRKNLQVTVWAHDALQENQFWGGVEVKLADLDLKEEIISWYPLKSLPRS